MVHFSQIEKKIVRVLCDACSERGTAFLISDRWLLTAEHVIAGHAHDPNEGVTIEIPYLNDKEFSVKAKVIDLDDTLDIALLELLEPLDDVQGLKLVSAPIRYNSPWETFGYPKAKLTAGEKISGLVNRARIQNEALIWDLDLSPNDEIGYDDDDGTEALSGSPVIINGVVQGVVLRQLEGSLGAISIEKISGFLEKNGILYEIAPESNELPEGLSEVAKEALLNRPVFEDLEQHIIEAQHGFLLMKGSPGSGKTTFNATYIPESEEIDICGKYFVRNDLGNTPVSYRASEFTFAEWLDANIHRILYNTVPEKRDRLLHEWIAHLSDGLHKLSAHYVKKNQIGVFLIDGVDDVHQLGKTTEFFSLIPERLPENIVVIISCQTEEVLPPHLQVQCSLNRVIKVVPFEIKQCRDYILTRTVGLELPFALVDSISEKSEGHPLYLRYLVEYVKQLDDVNKIESWIRDVPVFDGEIGNYYESIWQTVRKHQHEVWILATVSRLRSGIDRASLELMLPVEARFDFFTVFPKVQHLLVNDETISMYHSSFAMYINERTIEIQERVHRAISQFCIDHPECSYAVKNILFHMLNADEEMRKESVFYCNQEWADRCATVHVEPDIILEDLKQVLNAAITGGNISTVISILLLSQRISFRYNDIFARYAAELASTLIAMGRPKDAIRYIIRESVLIVSGVNAIFFLHRLNEAGAIDEAEQLFRAIRLKFVNELERGSVPNITIITYYAALTIKSGMTSQNPVYEFSNHIQRLIVLLKQSESVDEDSRLIEDIVAFNRAYLLWKRGMYISIQHYEQETAFGHGISTLLCKMLIHLEGFQAWGDSSVENSQYIEFIQDIKYVIKHYGIDEDDRYLILTALTDVDFEVDIVAQLIDEQMDLKETTFSIRESNGVDFDYESITNYLDAWRYKGFIDEGDNYPSILNYGTSNWELYFEELVSLVGYVLGKAWKGKSAKQDDSINNVATVVEQYLLPKLIVSLKERVKWDRSYALPEEFYPFVFNEIASFYIKYCIDKLPQFVEVIESHSLDQLGLYTEGFRQAMYSIIKEMIKSKKYVKSTFRLLKMLEDHIILGVQNRWDRSKDLLKIAEIYARIGSEPRSKAAFQHMLDTSMGPTWYKEDQLTLLETGITYLQSSGEMSNHLKEIAGHYDFASGEITFQRYVRQVKEAFIGNLCTMGRVTQAVEYFKNSILPIPEKVLQLAEEDQIDTPETGKGYIFGAGGLDEQSCILEILENAPNVKGLLKWAFCELYLIGDDRYFDRYTKIMADLLNERETIGSDELPVLYRRLLRIMISDMSPDNRKSLLSYLKRDLSDSNYNHLISLLQKAGMRLEVDEGDSDWTRRATQDIDISDKAYTDDENDGLYLPGTFGRRSSLTELAKQMLLAKDQLDIENIDLAKQHFIEGLKEVQFGGWDIWTSRSGAEVVETFEMLSGLSSTEEFVKSLCSLILNEIHANDWVIVNKLITSIGEKLDSSDASSIFHSLLEHIRFMLRTPDAYIEKYEWFEQESQDVSNNVLMTDLFIWLFNHPKSVIEDRAPEIMKGLVRTDPSFFVPMLINKSISKDTSLSPEICAGILHSLAIEDASLVWEYIQIKENQERIVELDHFMVKHTFMEIVKLAGKNNANANDYYTILSESFLNEIPKRLFDFNEGVETPYWLSHFHEILEPLEQIGVLDKNDYQEIMQYVSELCLPLSVEDFIRADIYVTRSYRSNQEFERLEIVVRKGINNLLSKRVGKEHLTRVANHLRIYNPYFPREGIRLTSKPSLISSVNDLISGKGDHAENCTHEGAYDYLHYLETVFCLEEGRFKLIEIIGFLVGQNAFQSPFNLDDVYQSYFSNEQPNFQNTPTTDSHIYGPAVYKVEPKPKLSGGIMTPAFLHPYLVEVLGEIREQDVIRESWLEGRDWDVDRIGMPLREGCRLLVSKEAVNQLSLTPWRLVWLVKYDFNRSFIIDRGFKMIYPFD